MNSQEPPPAEKETRRNKAKPVERQGFWWLNVSPKIRSLSTWPVGAVQAYPLYSGSRRHDSPPFPDAKPGDLVIGYESAPVKQVVALAKVCAEPDGDTVSFEKLEGLSTPIDDSVLKECPELAGMEFFRSARGSLSPLTAEEYGLILDIIRQENPIQPPETLEELPLVGIRVLPPLRQNRFLFPFCKRLLHGVQLPLEGEHLRGKADLGSVIRQQGFDALIDFAEIAGHPVENPP